MPRIRNDALSAYDRAIRASRAAQGSLTMDAARRIRSALDAAVTEVVREYRRSRTMPAARLNASLANIDATMRALDAEIRAATEAGRALSASRVSALWATAAERAATAFGFPDGVFGGVRTPPLTLLTAADARLQATAGMWRTALSQHAQLAGTDLQTIVREAVAAQVSPDELARRLRPYVVGAEDFHRAFPGEVWAKLRDLRNGTPAHLRDGARKLKANAERIAFSEIDGARHEAEVQAMAADPFVQAVRWTLSPNRGHMSRSDVCDCLAGIDAYGLGPGVFPVSRVPGKPHPRCRCERMPVLRADPSAPKPDLERQADPTRVRIPRELHGKSRLATAPLTPAQAARVRADYARALA